MNLTATPLKKALALIAFGAASIFMFGCGNTDTNIENGTQTAQQEQINADVTALQNMWNEANMQLSIATPTR